MQFTFKDLCLRPDADYALLRRRTDACSQLGRSYEIPCTLPDSCTPGEATIGFCRTGERYILYIRPQVCYHGTSAALAELFAPGMRSFPSFPALADQLRRFGRELTAPPKPSPQLPPLCLQLRAALGQQVLGQEAAVEAAAFRLYTHICKKQPARPLSLVLYGPTGVGKSELGKAIAPVLRQLQPQRHWHTVWTELNTFTEPHSVYRLTGSPPGYVGYDDQPVLESVRRSPCTVFMFDELDKAHPEVLKAFMSILDEGRCAARREDEQGQRELDFRRCIFIFTTNLDLSAAPARKLGFSPASSKAPPEHLSASADAPLVHRLLDQDESARRAMVRSGVLREIAARFTGLIGFRPLDETSLLRITAKLISALGREFGLCIVSVSPEIVSALTPKGAFSVRSTAAVLEGVLTPVFTDHISQGGAGYVHLSGTPEQMALTAAHPAVNAFCAPFSLPRNGKNPAVHEG